MIPCVVNLRKRTCSTNCMRRAWRLAGSAPKISHAQSASFQGIGFLSGHNTSRADGVSADGSVVVGLLDAGSATFNLLGIVINP
jgi:hypothetical protein